MTGDVLIEREGSALRVTLQRPRALNALTLPMIRRLHAAVEQARDEAIDRVILRGDGRAFCAGGDMRAVCEAVLAGDRAGLPRAFFFEEYRVNHAIATLNKPWIALIDGVAMGGGLGISVHGSHRVVTEQSVLAMPELAIGMVPDVGASFFLPRLPGEVGTWLALTGARLGAAEALSVGLATHFVPRDRLDALSTALGSGPIGPTLARFAEPTPASLDSPLDRGAIDRLFASDDLDEIGARLGTDDGALSRAARSALAQASPTCAAITLRLLRARAPSLAACLRAEYRAVRAVVESADFAEGVRSVLVEKTRDARFGPVDAATVARAFAPPEEGDWSPTE